jgi:hypothetical protein
MTGFQRVVAGSAACAIALRSFFPVNYRFGTDLYTTVLHLLGILAIAAALFFLVPSPDFGRLWTTFGKRGLGAVLSIGWLAYLMATVVWWTNYGFPSSIRMVHWPATGAAIAAVSLLFWVSRVWLRRR